MKLIKTDILIYIFLTHNVQQFTKNISDRFKKSTTPIRKKLILNSEADDFRLINWLFPGNFDFLTYNAYCINRNVT